MFSIMIQAVAIGFGNRTRAANNREVPHRRRCGLTGLCLMPSLKDPVSSGRRRSILWRSRSSVCLPYTFPQISASDLKEYGTPLFLSNRIPATNLNV